jgi:DNA polymerase III sliding clamp (beta) subunit (PCNA family)
MAFVSLNQKELQRLLSICNQISPRTSDVEIFTFTKITLKSDTVELSCFNSTLFFHSSLKPTNLDTQGAEVSFLIKTELLASSVNLVHDEMVSLNIDLDKTTLILQGSTSKHTLRINLEMLDNFITPERQPDKVQAKIGLDSDALLGADKIAQIAVGNPRTVYQPEFLNICYSLMAKENKMAVVSTDRYRMVKILLDVQVNEAVDEVKQTTKNYLLNPKNLNILSSAVDSKSGMELTFETDSLWAKVGESELVMRYGDGVYPDYDKILPQSFACNFLLNTKETLEALKQVFYLARMNSSNKSMTVQVEPEKKQMIFSANTSDGYASESSVTLLEYDGSQDSWSQSFNAEYLIDYINTTSAERILWEANPSKPSVLSPEGQKDKQLYLVSGLK